ncbi:MAG: acetyl-CoA hydrolase/transferase family protein [Acidimicrobiia bacterium]|nr:acetyl-CoA hydrolase/transferase family protein [Acidimicrobiia bacterium]
MTHSTGASTACSAAQAVADISSGERVFIGSGAAEPVSLVSAMTERAPELRDVSVLHIYTIGPAPYAEPGYEESFRHISFFVGSNVRQAVWEGRADTVPIHLHEVPRMFEQHHRLDWALVQLSRPDRHGYCTVGVSADVVVAAMRNARHVVAELNPQMPRTHGNNQIHISELHATVEVDTPLPEVVPPEVDETIRRIGENVASLVRDGDCLQAGIGSVPNAALAALTGHRHLGVHTEALTDGIVDLVEAGAIDNSRKHRKHGKTVCAFVLGTQALYDFVDDNPSVAVHGSEYVNDPAVIAGNDDVVAINSALQVDLTGQVNADSLGSSIWSGFGGQVDFIRGAAQSRNGRPIIALPATAKGGTVSRIVAGLEPGSGVVTTRADVHHVVTEYGVADLFGRPVRERIEALVSIAHPDHRDGLLDDARRLGLLR